MNFNSGFLLFLKAWQLTARIVAGTGLRATAEAEVGTVRREFSIPVFWFFIDVERLSSSSGTCDDICKFVPKIILFKLDMGQYNM